jgi:hypothetical protein
MSESYESVLQLSKMIANLERWLDKASQFAAQKKFDPNVLLQARLAPDMYSLTQQVQSACDGAKYLAARLSGKEPPKHPDTEQNYEEVRKRVHTVQTYLAGFSAADFAGADTRVVPLGFMPGKGLASGDFRREMNMPNTYFHLCMAYAILRHNGVDVGKMDFLGSLRLRDL